MRIKHDSPIQRVAIYARYSTDRQSPTSIAEQIAICTDLADRNGWEVVAQYADPEMTGAIYDARPELQRMLADVPTGLFDCILAEGIDRLARDQEHSSRLFKHVSFRDITLYTVREGLIDQVKIGMYSTIAAMQREATSFQTWRSQREHARRGQFVGAPPYGYQIKRSIDADGRVESTWAIHEEHAKVVLRIYSEFSEGRSPRAIARGLTQDHIPTPDGLEVWRDTTIRGHHLRSTGILRNRIYDGVYSWNKQQFKRNPDTERRVSFVNAMDERTECVVEDLRIIPRELWTEVENRLATIRNGETATKIRESKFWHHRRPKHLFTGLIRCADCNAALMSVGRDYLACPTAKHGGDCSNSRGVRRRLVEEQALDGLRHHLMQPELVQAFAAEFRRQFQAATRDVGAHRRDLERKLATATSSIENLLEAIMAGSKGPAITAKLEALEIEKVRLEQDLALPDESNVVILPNAGEAYARKVASLIDALGAPETVVQASEALRTLIEAILVRPFRGGAHVEVVGIIQELLSIAGPERKTAAPFGTAAILAMQSSVKVVAGAGFEPATFRL